MRTLRAKDIRAPAVAGMFYPDDAAQLRYEIEKLLAETPPQLPTSPIIAAVAPHAGYMYSGPVAAYTFKALQAGYSLSSAENFLPTIAIVAPSHRDVFPYISVFNGEAYRTPLGDVPIAHEIAATLIAANEKIIADGRGHHTEHALEVELPFLQMIWPSFRLVPVVMGDQDWESCQLLGEALAQLARTSPLFILASSDLSHYFTDEEAAQLDGRFIEHLQAFDPAALHQALATEECQACGGGPVVATMIAAKALGANQVDILRYQNSGDASGDYHTVVGYLAATFGIKDNVTG